MKFTMMSTRNIKFIIESKMNEFQLKSDWKAIVYGVYIQVTTISLQINNELLIFLHSHRVIPVGPESILWIDHKLLIFFLFHPSAGQFRCNDIILEEDILVYIKLIFVWIDTSLLEGLHPDPALLF